MAFIKATWAMNGSNITLNVDQIVAVADNEGKAIVHTNISTGSGHVTFWLDDSYATILNKIAAATQEAIV